MIKKFNSYKLHILFISLLSLNYFLPLLIFGKVTLFYHDTLDSEIVYNHVLGKIFSGNLDGVKLFLNGEIKIEYLRRLFQPFTLFYGFLNTELAYWLTDIILKLTSYFSFYLFTKKTNSSKFVNCLSASLFASINLPTFLGFGMAILPYLAYLCLFKDKIKIKNYLIVIFFGFNSDLVNTIFALPFFFLALLILNKNILEIKKILFIMLAFIFPILLSNSNLILSTFSEVTFHRSEFQKIHFGFYENLLMYFTGLFRIPTEYNWTLLAQLPLTILLMPTFILCIIKREVQSLRIFLLILFVELIRVFLNTGLFTRFYNNYEGLFAQFTYNYIAVILPFLYAILVFILLKKTSNKILIFIVFLSVIVCQLNSSVVPFAKKNILKEQDYRNIYTFDGYYLYSDFKKIKEIVKNQRVLSVGYDPMIAVMNNIYTIDGYHNLYPLDYKIKFRDIISKELEKNLFLKNYYDTWGHRVYAFLNDPEDIEINFAKANKIGANYIISKYKINKAELNLIDKNFESTIYLYKIE